MNWPNRKPSTRLRPWTLPQVNFLIIRSDVWAKQPKPLLKLQDSDLHDLQNCPRTHWVCLVVPALAWVWQFFWSGQHHDCPLVVFPLRSSCFFSLYDWFVQDDVVIGTLNEVPFVCMYLYIYVFIVLRQWNTGIEGQQILAGPSAYMDCIGSDVRPKRRSNGRSQQPMIVHLRREREQEVQNAPKKMCYLAQYMFDWFIKHPKLGQVDPWSFEDVLWRQWKQPAFFFRKKCVTSLKEPLVKPRELR